MSSVKPKRIEWIDIAKGIGILLVILGHSVQFGSRLHNLIFSFHMPLFFILSGMVYNHKNNKTFLHKKFISLIIPYIIFSIIGLLISIIIPFWRSGLNTRAIMKDIYLTNPDAANVSSVWFLICLFIVSVFFNFIQKVDIKVQYIVVGLCLIVGIFYAKLMSDLTFLPDGRLPFNLDTSLISLTFFAIGVWMKIYITDCKVFWGSCVIFTLTFVFNGRVNLHGLTFNNPILYIMESISGAIIVIFLCFIISTKNKQRFIIKMLKWLGEHSLIILGVQAIAVRGYILIVNTIENKAYYLYGLPVAHQVSCFVNCTLLSVLVCMVIDVIKDKETD